MKVSELMKPTKYVPTGGASTYALACSLSGGSYKIPMERWYYRAFDEWGYPAHNSFLNNNAAAVHRSHYRGKYKGNWFSDPDSASVKNGSFVDLFVGDYWYVSGTYWMIADFDYFLGSGTDAHHMVLVPTRGLVSCPWGVANSDGNYYTDSGYAGSALRNYDKSFASSAKSQFFRTSSTYTEYIISKNHYGLTQTETAVTIGPTEAISLTAQMVFGHHAFDSQWNARYDVTPPVAPCGYGTNQLALFMLNPMAIRISSGAYWLWDSAGLMYAARVNTQGHVSFHTLNDTNQCRPYIVVM